jgi:AmmeMemoRadiSam system protein A
MISKAEGKKLIGLARESIMACFSEGRFEAAPGLVKKFSTPQGGFVTLTIGGRLRGCIGYVEPVFPLYETIMRAARSAAFEDPRFPPVKQEEFKQVQIEISVLSLPELIEVEKTDDYLQKIKIGEDGLIIRGRFGSGLLLPQVFTEYKSTPKTALEMTCQKAGLPSDAWKDLHNRIYKFHAEIFSEKAEKRK